MATATELIQALSRALVLSESGSMDDPEMLEACERVRTLQEEAGWQILRVTEDSILVHGEPVPEGEGDGDVARLRDALHRARIRELRLQDPVEPETWRVLFGKLQPGQEDEGLAGVERFRGLEESLGMSFQPGDGPIRGMAGSIQSLFERTPPGMGAERPQGMGTDTATRGEGDAGPAESGPSLPPDLQGKVEAFFSTSGAERDRLAQEIQAEAARMKDVRNLNGAADLLEVLVHRSAEGADAQAISLARRITFPGAASQIVARIGGSRDEAGRARLIRISSGLGREMALALADALGEARDRFQRRIFLDALVAQGNLGLEMAQGMVEDPRWFVVRNGVALLGEIGGEDRISFLTGPLANPDSRVRKETVLALSKIDGENARLLLLGMLDDPDPDVRAVACRAVGLLKMEKALRPLLRILEEDQNENVQVECLEALGKIEDPGAVPFIEKRAVGGLFSRPATEIRVAAYRALAGIGTPRAKTLLKKAATDSDPEVRGVAQSLIV